MSKKRTRIGTKLLWLSAVVLVVPWLGIESLHTMKRFLIEGQQQSQLQLAEGIASLLNNDAVLEDSLRTSVNNERTIALYTSEANHLVDGYRDEWRSLDGFKQTFGSTGDKGFDMILAQRGASVFGWISVIDGTPQVYRPGSNPLKNTDHVQLFFESQSGDLFSVVLLFEGNGAANAYRVASLNKVVMTSLDRRFQSEVLLRPGGYDLEFRFPANLVTEARHFGVTVVDAGFKRQDTLVTSTFDAVAGDGINPVSMRSQALEKRLLDYAADNTRLWIIDSDRQVKALVGQLQSEDEAPYSEIDNPWWQTLFHWITGSLVGITPGPFQDFDAATIQSRNDGIYQQALSTGMPVVGARDSLDGRAQIITAAVPLGGPKEPSGVLLQEKSMQNILLLQRQSLEKLMLITIAAMASVTLALLLFALWLTLRIRRLGSEISAVVDNYGRLKSQKSIRLSGRGDEIDDVALRINGMLARLDQYQSFLKTIPRVLRHEINNPLNTIATSLDRLKDKAGQQGSSATYLNSASRGLERINHVINRVTEAASLEQAMQEGDREPLDLTQLVSTYLAYQRSQSPVDIDLLVPSEPLFVMACGDYLELLLDKLLDNALDHSQHSGGEGAPIKITLSKDRGRAVLTVENRGPLIAESDLPNLFNFMFSQRQDREQHLGLGLYIVQLITEFHGGSVEVNNLADGSGVCFVLKISLCEVG